MAHAEVIGIDDQEPGVIRIAQEPVCFTVVQRGSPSRLLAQILSTDQPSRV
jgi:hypothetical protein